MLSFMSVFLVLFMLIYFITCIQTNRSLDTLADIVSENEGKFPEFEELKIEGKKKVKASEYLNGIDKDNLLGRRFMKE